VKEVQDFLEADCKLARPRTDIFIAVFNRTGGNPCQTGCAFYEDGQCLAFRKVFSEDPAAKRPIKAKKDPQQQTTKGYVPPTKKPFRW
jgi:hypothetical protein